MMYAPSNGRDLGVFKTQGQEYRVKSEIGTASASGNTELVSAVSGKKLRIIAYIVYPITISSGSVTIKLQSSNGTPVVLEGPMDFVDNEGMVNSDYKHTDSETEANEAININLSATATVTVKVWYIEV